MDSLLAEIRLLIASVDTNYESLDRLQAAFRELDQWMASGKLPPLDWTPFGEKRIHLPSLARVVYSLDMTNPNEVTRFWNEVRWAVPWQTETEHGVALVSARSGEQARERALEIVYRETRQHAHTWGVAYPHC